MMPILLTYVLPVLHVLSCIFLIVVVLLQTGKGADMGAVFGGGRLPKSLPPGPA